MLPEEKNSQICQENRIPEAQDIFLMLTSFCKCRKELVSYISAVKGTIHEHLLSFNKEKPLKDKHIFEICETASKILSPEKLEPVSTPDAKEFEGYGGMTIQESPVWDIAMEFEGEERKLTPHQFQTKWLANVPLLLPGQSEILQCLPYLLTCYTKNICTYWIDPFDEGETTSGWDDLFKKEEYPDTGNRSRSIRILENCFVDFPRNISFDGLFKDGDEHIYSSKPSEGVLSDFLVLKQKPEWKEAKKDVSDYVLHWELYRRFAAFCEACAGNEAVNITLSMALFSCGMTRLSGRIKGVEDKLFSYSYEEVVQDSLRDEILSLTRKYDDCGGLKAIHEHTYFARLLYLDYINKKSIQ